MRNKDRDIKYCGVDEKKIVQAVPKINEGVFTHLVQDYIIGRYKLHLQKDIEKLPAPWTTNEILKNYRFTNVKRELDKQTKWLIKNISTNNNLSYKDKILNTILFRLFSKYETMEIIGAPFEFSKNRTKEYVNKICKNVEKYAADNPKYKWFTTAFFTNGVKGILGRIVGSQYIHPVRVIRYLFELSEGMYDKDSYWYKAVKSILDAQTQEECYKALRSQPAFGDFIAYQIYVDFTYIKEFPFSENEFTVSGVGCIKGLKYLFSDFDGLSYEEALFWLRDNIEQLANDILKINLKFVLNKLMYDVPYYDRNMNVMSLENCMCELGKYMDIINQTGRKRPKYKGVK